MKKSEIKVNLDIVSPNGFIWTIIKKYSSSLILIKSRATGKVVCLKQGQFRQFKIIRKDGKDEN